MPIFDHEFAPGLRRVHFLDAHPALEPLDQVLPVSRRRLLGRTVWRLECSRRVRAARLRLLCCERAQHLRAGVRYNVRRRKRSNDGMGIPRKMTTVLRIIGAPAGTLRRRCPIARLRRGLLLCTRVERPASQRGHHRRGRCRGVQPKHSQPPWRRWSTFERKQADKVSVSRVGAYSFRL